MKSNRTGFSLVELLVVIAIIGTLAGITSGVAMAAKAKAQSVSCQKNLGDWAKGLNMLIDARRTHAFPSLGNGSRDDASAWYNLIPSFLDSPKLSNWEGRLPTPQSGIKSFYVCPCAAKGGENAIFSYAYNRYLEKNGTAFRAPQVRYPAETLVFMDSCDASTCHVTESAVLRHGSDSFRHGGRINMAFSDGHVNSFKYADVQRGSEAPSEINPSGILWDPWALSGGESSGN